jgi:hypothetical protein
VLVFAVPVDRDGAADPLGNGVRGAGRRELADPRVRVDRLGGVGVSGAPSMGGPKVGCLPWIGGALSCAASAAVDAAGESWKASIPTLVIGLLLTALVMWILGRLGRRRGK